MTVIRATIVAVLMVYLLPSVSWAQPNMSILSSKAGAGAAPGDAGDLTQVAVPAGALASVGSDDTEAGAGPIFGFQIWKRDTAFLGVFFTFAPASTISGTQNDFGAFVLNAPAKGTSFFVSGNQTPWPLSFSKDPFAKPKILLGYGGRAGVTNSTWETGTDTETPAREDHARARVPSCRFTGARSCTHCASSRRRAGVRAFFAAPPAGSACRG
jgi:hypothetical protein